MFFQHFISNQPFVKYQEAIINAVVQQNNNDLCFETVGNANNKTPLSSAVAELGSYIWAVAPSIFKMVRAEVREEHMELVKKTYGHFPLLYDMILYNKK